MPGTKELLLHVDQPQSLANCRQAELRVVSGIVWLTVAGATDDVFLQVGERYSFTGRRPVVIEAVRTDARIEISPVTSTRNMARLVARPWLHPYGSRNPAPTLD